MLSNWNSIASNRATLIMPDRICSLPVMSTTYPILFNVSSTIVASSDPEPNV
jgi:hypothetical protein